MTTETILYVNLTTRSRLDPFVRNGRSDGVPRMYARFQVHETEIGEELQVRMHIRS